MGGTGRPNVEERRSKRLEARTKTKDATIKRDQIQYVAHIAKCNDVLIVNKDMLVLSLSVPAAAATSASTSSWAAAVNRIFLGRRSGRQKMRTVVAMADLLGDLGARDPFPAEIESNFGEKVVGNVDTLHRILIPTLSALSLAEAAPLSLDDARRLLHKVVGWRLILSEFEDKPCRLQCLWKVRDEPCGTQLIARITAALDGAGHYSPAELVFEGPPSNHEVRAELSSDGSLTVNDYVIAARIDQVKTLDLIPKKRVWA